MDIAVKDDYQRALEEQKKEVRDLVCLAWNGLCEK